jgi:hypothetical protein
MKRKIRGLKLLLIFMALIMGGCATPSTTPTSTQTIELTNLTQAKSIVKVETESVIVHYQNESYWEERQYSIILQNRAKFSSDLIAKFVGDVSKPGARKRPR